MKTRKLFLLLITIFTLSSRSLFSQSGGYNKPFAIFMSVIVPGMGQVYGGQLDKGLAIWSASTALSVGFLLTIAELDLESTGGSFPFNLGLQFKPQLTQNEWYWVAGLGAGFLAVYLYNILDVAITPPKNFQISFDHEMVRAEYQLAF